MSQKGCKKQTTTPPTTKTNGTKPINRPSFTQHSNMHTQTTNRQSMGNTQTINVKTNETGTCAEREEKKGEEKKGGEEEEGTEEREKERERRQNRQRERREGRGERERR